MADLLTKNLDTVNHALIIRFIVCYQVPGFYGTFCCGADCGLQSHWSRILGVYE